MENDKPGSNPNDRASRVGSNIDVIGRPPKRAKCAASISGQHESVEGPTPNDMPILGRVRACKHCDCLFVENN